MLEKRNILIIWIILQQSDQSIILRSFCLNNLKDILVVEELNDTWNSDPWVKWASVMICI